MARQPHKKVHANCEYGASTWAECDRARDDEFGDWQAMQQVILAYNLVVAAGGVPRWARGEHGQFAQLIQLIGGEREYLTNIEGNPAVSPWSQRLMAAVERVKAGELPRYNLYEPALPAEQEATMPHDTDVAPETESESKAYNVEGSPKAGTSHVPAEDAEEQEDE